MQVIAIASCDLYTIYRHKTFNQNANLFFVGVCIHSGQEYCVNTVSGLMLQHIWCIHFSQLSHEICKIMLTKCIEPACSY